MASIHAIDATQVQNARPPFSTDEVGAYLHYVAKSYDDLLDGTFFVHGHVHGGLRPVIRAMDWTAKHGVAPQTWFGTTHAYDMAHDGPMPAHLGLHPEDLSRKRHGNYRNGEFFASRLSIRRRSVDFYRKAYDTVVRDAKCADVYNGVTTRLPKPFEGYSDGSDCPQPRRYGPRRWRGGRRDDFHFYTGMGGRAASRGIGVRSFVSPATCLGGARTRACRFVTGGASVLIACGNL